MRLVLLAGWLAVAAAFRPSSHTPPSSSASSRDVWNPWAVSSDDPEPQLLVAEHVAPAFKVHVTDAFSPTSDPPRRERINEAREEKLKVAAALGSVFDSDSAEQAPERQLIGAERVAPSVAKVHAAESSPSSKRARINKLKLAEPLGSVFDSDSTEVHGVSTEAATSPLSPQRLAEIEAKALADAMAASRRRRARAASGPSS